MSSEHHTGTVVSDHDPHSLSLGKYVFGFVASVALTMTAYLLVTRSDWSTGAVVATISALAIAQFVVQVVFFLHVGDELRPRWKLATLLFMLGIVVVVVVGSVWIMNNLDYRMMHNPRETQQYLDEQGGF